VKRRTVVIVSACIALAAGFGIFNQRFSHEAAWRRVPAERQAYVDRALAAGAEAFNFTPSDYRRLTRPRLWQRPGRVCVTLASPYRDGAGSYQACYARSDGRLVWERALICSFGAVPLADRVWERIW
jgi:hypothetical protein